MKQIPANLEAIELDSDTGLGCDGHFISFFVKSSIDATVSSSDKIITSETGNLITW